MSDAPAHAGRLPAGTRLGSYRLVRCIGEGGMGTVYEGVHEGLGKRVAIKTLHAQSARSEEVIARFLREGKAAAKIHHPNVVDVSDVAVHEGTPYLVMEYLQGEDLGAHMEHAAPMPPQAIADLMIPVVSALSAAHEAGIVHRDLKPDNILIHHGKAGALEPKLLDFGISKLSDESLHLTGTNAILGTPYYMSPEQAGSSKHVDHRSDLFSLGVILYQCATHELPFKGDSLFKLLGEILHSEPPTVSTLAQGIPPAFEAVIARAMKKDPALRFQSAAELGSALLPFASARVRLGYEHEFAEPAGGSLAASYDGSLGPVSAVARAPRPAGGARVLLALALLGVIAAAVIAALAGGPPRGRERARGETPPARTAAGALQAAPTGTAVAITAAGPTRTAAPASGQASDAAAEVAAPAGETPQAAAAVAPAAREPSTAGASRSTRRANRRERAPAAADVPAAPPPPPAQTSPVRAEPASPGAAPPEAVDLFRDRK
jgi:serine/threonine-protein kinase